GTLRPPYISAKPRRRSPAISRASIARDLELAPKVEAGDLLEDVRRHRPAPLRLHVRPPVRVPRLRRLPDRDTDDFVPVGGYELERPQHPFGELARLPGAAELLAGTGPELPGR